MERDPRGPRPVRAEPGTLTVVHGDDAGLVFSVGEDDAIIGRGASADIQVRGPGVSRQHAKLIRNAVGKVVLVDLGSANGTYVNDQSVRQRELRTGDHIRIAREVVLSFQYDQPDFRDTQDLAERSPRRRGAVDGSLLATTINIGRLHLSSGDCERAVRSLNQALTKMRSFSDTPPDELASVLADLAECHLRLGNGGQARIFAEESVNLAQRSSADPRISAQANFVLAQVLVDLDIVRARELALAARKSLEDREPLARKIDAWLT